MAYGGVMGYPMGWTILLSLILKNRTLKTWKSSFINTMENIESAWATERKKMAPFQAMWQKGMQALEMGVTACGSG